MSTVKLLKWGNSMGLRIPAAIIKKAHWGPNVELEIQADETGKITISPVRNQQQGWLEKFNAIADSDLETPYFEVENDFDKDEWTW